MRKSENYGMNLIDSTDFVNIDEITENFELIDCEVGTPKYTISSSDKELVSGEKLPVALGKLARIVKSFISHVANTNNAHGLAEITYAEIDDIEDSVVETPDLSGMVEYEGDISIEDIEDILNN
jgi:hypothetical protein